MKIKIAIVVVLLALVVCFAFGCEPKNEGTMIESNYDADSTYDFETASIILSQIEQKEISVEFLENLGETAVATIINDVDNGNYSSLSWLNAAGCSMNVINDILSGDIKNENVTDLGNNGEKFFTIAFAGDICLDPNSAVMKHAERKLLGVKSCFDNKLLGKMKEYDIFMLNHEYAASDLGAPLKDKMYTFRAKPDSIETLADLGVDIVSLANNHVYDYGKDAFFDTLKNLKEQKMPYVGAGKTFDEASQPHYYIVNGIKIAVVAASSAENYRFTPVASGKNAGVMGTYRSDLFIEEIKKAKENSDIVIVYVHWGAEYTTEIEENQSTMGRAYIDAGASVVIGGHSHCMQGSEYYKGSLIFYSLGNFWFNDKELDSGILCLSIDRHANIKASLVPLLQKGCETRLVSKANDRRAYFDRYESLPPQGVKLDNEGVIFPSGQ